MSSTEVQRYFCHQCNSTCVPEPPDYLCPTCNDGFIEPISASSPSPPLFIGQDHMFGPPPPPLGADMMGPGGNEFPMNILVRDMLQPLLRAAQAQHSRQGGQAGSNTSSESTDSTPDNDQATQQQQPPQQQPPQPLPQQSRSSSSGGHSHRIHSSNTGHIRMSPFQSVRRIRIGARGARGEGGGLQIDANNDVPTLFSQIISSLSGDTQVVGNPGDYAWGPGGLDNIISQLIGQLDGSGPAPAQEDSIDKLPDVYVPKKFIDDKLDCTVCQEYFEEEVKVKQLPCKHYFHMDCIVPWLKLHNSCPICRDPIDASVAASQDVDMMPAEEVSEEPSPAPAPAQAPTPPAPTAAQVPTAQASIHEDDLD